jgi:CheY-like chemotaxis protein
MKEKNINFVLDAKRLGEEWAVFDREQFMRVILNLLSNALKFTPDGGTVKVTAASSRKGRYADYVISVKDNGIGMSKEFAENVFEAFTREQTSTVSQIQGTGLGMSISKNIIDSMGGTIRVVTAPEKGTKFVIRLKLELCEPVSEKDVIEAAPSSDFDFSGKTILLVDDMKINRKMESLLLENLGLTVETAENGQVALDKLNEREYDAVLMDIQMPVMNGYEATKKIRLSPNPRVAGVPVVAVTANAFGEDIRKAESAGVNGYVSKPIDLQKLRDVLIETLK